MGKIKDLELKQKELEAIILTNKKKKFRLPNQAKQTLRKKKKLPHHIVTQYLGQDGNMKFKLCPIVSGNIIVVNNKAHKINPKDLWRYGKLTWYIHREISRDPVSNQDYDKVKEDGKDTDSDVVLIKAVLGAMFKPKKEVKKSWVIWIIVIVVLAILGFIFLGGNGGTPGV